MKRLLPVLVLAVLLASSCSTTYRTMREPNVRFELTGHDYVLSEEAVTGEATVLYVLGIDWKHLFGLHDNRGEINAPVMGLSSIIKGAETYAIADLIANNPGYDFVMYPQITKKYSRFPLLYSKITVTVKARMGKLVSPKECCKK
ncbi:MAG: hypothetical protein J6X89_03235 [Bacteroidales bacterium]|nr:hypothetical protein [Bacteroidales bacterium]